MHLRERIEAFSGRLTPADRAILDVLLSHPTEAAFLPADRITGRANVHAAAATRLARKLGYDGYPGLRESLQHELLDGADTAERIRNRLDHAGSPDVLADLVAQESAALNEAVRTISRADLEFAAHRVLTARRVLLFGWGNAAVLAELLQRRLRRFGIAVEVLGPTDRDVAEVLVSLSPDDLVLGVALRRVTTRLRLLLSTVEEVGAATVLITDTLDGRLRPRPELVLTAARGNGREFQSLTVPMAVANALVLTVARAGGERVARSLGRLDELLERFGD